MQSLSIKKREMEIERGREMKRIKVCLKVTSAFASDTGAALLQNLLSKKRKKKKELPKKKWAKGCPLAFLQEGSSSESGSHF
jgi:hypothetical protein